MSKEIWVAVITASGTIVAALIAAAVAIGTGNVAVPGFDGSPSVRSLQQEVSALTAANDELVGQVADLQAQLEAAGETPATTTGTTGTTGTTAADDVARSTEGTPIRMSYGTCLDLDTSAANWGVPDGDDFCITFGRDVEGDTMTVLDQAPDAAMCAEQTQVDNYLSNADTLLDKHLCITSSAGRYADIQVVDINGDVYSLEITVWK